MSDPRVFFAAERTLLAWVRSSITVIALGFVVSRFGLFLELLRVQGTAPDQSLHSHWASTALGIALVVLGSFLPIAALYNHTKYVRSLPNEDVPNLPIPWLTPALALSQSMIGFLMAAYLGFT